MSATSHMIYAHLATIKSREDNCLQVVNDILPQVDKLYIYFSKGYTSIPRWTQSILSGDVESKIIPILPKKDMGDAGKFERHHEEGYHVTIDDDLFYPNDFIARTVEALDKYRCAVAWGGKVMKEPPFASYYNRSWVTAYPITRGYTGDHEIDIPLTCGFAYDTSMITFSPEDFRHPNMADIWAGVKCRNEGVRIMAIAHSGIRHQPIDFSKTICSTTRRNDKQVTKHLNENWRG